MHYQVVLILCSSHFLSRVRHLLSPDFQTITNTTLAYKIINRVIISLTTPQQMVITTINQHMLVCFIMTVTVSIFTYITPYKNSEFTQNM